MQAGIYHIRVFVAQGKENSINRPRTKQHLNITKDRELGKKTFKVSLHSSRD